MEDIKDKAADLANHVEELADTYYRLAMVNVTQRASNIVSGAVVVLLLAVFAFFILLFGGLALGWWLGNLVDNRAVGFLLAAVFFALLFLGISYFKKKTIVPMIRDIVIRKMYD